jgi:hypothetical protein
MTQNFFGSSYTQDRHVGIVLTRTVSRNLSIRVHHNADSTRINGFLFLVIRKLH